MLKKALDILLALFLFCFFAIHLFFAAQGKKFWNDESDGLFYTRVFNFTQLLWDGAPPGQASRSPLPYLIDRLWMSFWNYAPQQYWDLRLFFRVPQVSFWALANVFLFFFLRRRFREWLPSQKHLATLAALAVSLFSYSNNFASFYAIESRAYSLWLALSMVHFLLLWDCLRLPDGKAPWKGFYFVSALLVFCTYTAAIQIAFAVGFLLLYARHTKAPVSLMTKRIGILLLCTVPITLFYLTKIPAMSYGSTWGIYGLAVLEVVLKAFHHHSHHPLFLTGPLMFLFVPLFWWKRDRLLALLSLHAIGLVLFSLPLFLFTWWKGGLFASRYVIYMVPGLTFLYVLGLFSVAKWIQEKVPLRLQQRTFLILLLLWSLSEVIGRPISAYKGTKADIARFSARNSYKHNEDPLCALEFPHEPEELEAFNDLCRKIQ